jgi:hypothetical protein
MLERVWALYLAHVLLFARTSCDQLVIHKVLAVELPPQAQIDLLVCGVADLRI